MDFKSVLFIIEQFKQKTTFKWLFIEPYFDMEMILYLSEV